jgi:hypothetical protein
VLIPSESANQNHHNDALLSNNCWSQNLSDTCTILVHIGEEFDCNIATESNMIIEQQADHEVTYRILVHIPKDF